MMILKDVQQLNFNRRSFFIQLYILYQKIVASIPTFQIFGWILCIVIEYRIHVVYLIKKVSTYTSYKKTHFEL